MLMILFAVSCLGCWFLFDGLVAYPRNNVKAEIYFRLQEQFGEGTPELKAAWEAVRKERVWNDSIPKKIYSQGDIQTQWVLGGVTLLVAVALVIHFFRSLPLTTCLNDGVITLPDGRKVEVARVRAVSKKRWKSKGIADLVYESAPGTGTRFILDDYKFVGAARILEEVEKYLTPPAGHPDEPVHPEPQAS
ncbi:MAG: hypothetical protein Fur0032_14410 [Terrimicrobiaceae bacterium]